MCIRTVDAVSQKTLPLRDVERVIVVYHYRNHGPALHEISHCCSFEVQQVHHLTLFVPIYRQHNQLDFLLSKASEYSNFIARDLDDLQSAMAEKALKTVQKVEKKKRKAEGKPPVKKAKIEDVKAGTKPIFVQPPTLAKGCNLKDYQLEGVRWLASLFENGVSGILAGKNSRVCCCLLFFKIIFTVTDPLSPSSFPAQMKWVSAKQSSVLP